MGSGKLLSQQLLAAGEHVVDVPPTLSARVRLLGSAKAAKNDGNDALSTAIAGLRHCGLRQVRGDDHTHGAAAAGRPLRRPGLVAHPGRVSAACGVAGTRRRRCTPPIVSADRAANCCGVCIPKVWSADERKRLAAELLADVRRLDRDLAAIKTRIRDAVDDVRNHAARAARGRTDRRRD